MKTKISKSIAILLSFVTVLIASYYLYWQGEVATQKASENFIALGFSNTKTNCSQNSLSFFIENNKKISESYKIEISLNDEIIENKIIKINAMEEKKIKPETELVKNICDKNDFSKYEISILTENNTYNIYKIINSDRNE